MNYSSAFFDPECHQSNYLPGYLIYSCLGLNKCIGPEDMDFRPQVSIKSMFPNEEKDHFRLPAPVAWQEKKGQTRH
jgi:hypothetical protein